MKLACKPRHELKNLFEKTGKYKNVADGRIILILIGKDLVWKNSLRKWKVILNAAMNTS